MKTRKDICPIEAAQSFCNQYIFRGEQLDDATRIDILACYAHSLSQMHNNTAGLVKIYDLVKQRTPSCDSKGELESRVAQEILDLCQKTEVQTVT